METKIPKIIHFCWFGEGKIPRKDRKCIASWRKYCPDYKIICWNEKNYDVTKNQYMKQAYDSKKWGFVSDYARLDIIYRYGGIYLDTDVELIKPLDELLMNSCYMGCEQGGYVNTGIGFGATKGNRHIKQMRDEYKNRVFINEDGSFNLVTIPVLSTNYLKELGFLPFTEEVQQVDNITIFPQEYFCPQDFETGKISITRNTYSIHHFHASWFSKHERTRHEVQKKLYRYLPEKQAKLLWPLVDRTLVYALVYEKKFNTFLKMLRKGKFMEIIITIKNKL